MKYDITLIGNYTNDTIITANGTKQVDGGGFNYGAHSNFPDTYLSFPTGKVLLMTGCLA